MNKLQLNLPAWGFIALIGLLLFPGKLSAQISFEGSPKSFSMRKSKAGKYAFPRVEEVRQLPLTKNVDDLLEQSNWDQSGASTRPFIVGECVRTNIDMATESEQYLLDDGTRVYRLRLQSEGAKAVYPTYSQFFIPQGAKLFVYNEDKTTVHGAYTYETNPQGGAFASMPVAGDKIVLEYESNEQGDAPEIVIDGLIHVFRPQVARMMAIDPGENTSEYPNCMINANCPEGDEWVDQKAGVVNIFTVYDDGTTSACTGALVNNTKQDFTPYILTAAHCAGGSHSFPLEQKYLDKWIFSFHYIKPDCSNASTATYYAKSMVGCTPVAYFPIRGRSDGLLLKLKQDIPLDYRVYYNGWDSNEVVPERGVSLHHPRADAMKISYFEELPRITFFKDFGGSSASGSHFELRFTTGTEGGSSGSPLFNMNKLIVGTLTGGGAACQNPPAEDYYGRLSAHWDRWAKVENKAGNPATQMATFLDPVGQGKTRVLQGTYRQDKRYYTPVVRVMAVTANKENTKVNVAWRAPLHMGEGQQVQYEIKRNGAVLESKVSHTKGTTLYQYEDQITSSDITRGMVNYQVRALYLEGETWVETAWSPIVAAYAAQKTTELTPTVSTEGGKKKLSWQKPVISVEWSKIAYPQESSFKPVPLKYRPQGMDDVLPLEKLIYRESWPYKGLPLQASSDENPMYIHKVMLLPSKANTSLQAYISTYDPAAKQSKLYDPMFLDVNVPSTWKEKEWVSVALKSPLRIDPTKSLFVGFASQNKENPAGISYAEGSADDYSNVESALYWTPEMKLKRAGFHTLQFAGAEEFGKNYMAIRLLISNSQQSSGEATAIGGKGLAILPMVKHYIVKKNGTEIAQTKALSYLVDAAASEDKFSIEVVYETDPAVYMKEAPLPDTHRVSIVKEGLGAVSVLGYYTLASVPKGTKMTVVAKPHKYNKLTSITANGKDITETKTFVVDSDVVVKAVFFGPKYSVTLRSIGNGSIKIKDHTEEQLKSVQAGTKLEVIATPESDRYVLHKLTANGYNIKNSMSFELDANTEVVAEFTEANSVEAVRERKLSLFPNPATDHTVVEGAASMAELSLLQMDGTVLLRTRTDANGSARLNLSKLPSGTYLVQVGEERAKLIVR